MAEVVLLGDTTESYTLSRIVIPGERRYESYVAYDSVVSPRGSPPSSSLQGLKTKESDRRICSVPWLRALLGLSRGPRLSNSHVTNCSSTIIFYKGRSLT